MTTEILMEVIQREGLEKNGFEYRENAKQIRVRHSFGWSECQCTEQGRRFFCESSTNKKFLGLE